MSACSAIWILIVSRVSQENRKLCEEPQSHQLLPLQAPRHALEGEGHLAVIFKAHCHTSKEPKRSLANQWLKFLDGRNKSKCPYICMILKYFKCLHAGVQSTKRNAKIKSLLVPPKRPGKQPSRASQGLQRVKPSKHAQWTEPQLSTCLPNDKMTVWIVSIAVEESRVGFYDSIHFIHLHWLCKLSM